MPQNPDSKVATDVCPVCGDGGAAASDFEGGQKIICRRCGVFAVTGTALVTLPHAKSEERRLLSSWIREQYELGNAPKIRDSTINRIAGLRLPTVQERADRFLICASRMVDTLGERFNAGDPKLIAATWSRDASEVMFLLRLLQEQGFAKIVALGGLSEISPAGYLRIDELRAVKSASDQAFVAMWFDERLRTVFDDGLAVGIRKAGYRPMRVDDIEHVGRIDDEIIAQIRRSRFLVADFTGHRGGVYFEAGFAQGLGLPVFWTCQEADVQHLHFDIRQFNCISWRTDIDLAVRLQLRIESVLGRGPVPDDER